MPQRYDAVVIGGGHNGLVAAAYLAKAGKKVAVLERRHVLGGAAVSEEIVPGYRFSVFSYVVSLLRPEIIRELELPKHGLEILPLDGTITPLDDDYLWRVNDHGRTVRELRRWSLNDAEAYEEYGPLMAEMARFIKPILSIVPPDPGKVSVRDWLPLTPLATTFKDLPKRLQTTFIQLMTMSAADFLDQWFETEPLKATMSASGIIGTFQGPRSPGTAYVLLHHYMGEIDGAFRAWGVPRGGTGSISEAIGNAALANGAEIRLEAPAARIDVHGDRATGVTLESGEQIEARIVLSSLDSRWTFIKLLEDGVLDPAFREEVLRYKYRGSSGKVNLALDGLPELACKPGTGEWLRGAVSFSPSLDYMERAYDDAKYGRPSRRPYIDMIIPTLVDPTMAPPGGHVMSCFVQYAPYRLAGDDVWDDAARAAFGQNVIDTISERFPTIRRHIVGSQFITPKDIEDITGLTEGNIFQGELSLEQLFFNRPVPGWARYRTPVRGLWMCGSATHPGGGIMGAPGRIAALEVLKGGKRGQGRRRERDGRAA
ncbi:MAG TPA: NAD(P)/FAD-dependent oxidoreductase [Actinomycetota bacterium]|jgi:phytoene dehydrogenase-like protein|nr:NAD(P)/FAD-dependent oxidoreductase [Actinomycetota bacterium]